MLEAIGQSIIEYVQGLLPAIWPAARQYQNIQHPHYQLVDEHTHMPIYTIMVHDDSVFCFRGKEGWGQMVVLLSDPLLLDKIANHVLGKC